MERGSVTHTHRESTRFSSPDEEIRYLREKVRSQQEALNAEGDQNAHARIAKREIAQYADVPAATVLHESFVMPEHETMRELLKLEPESHDAQIDQILTLVRERGVRNALAVVARTGNPHLEDDLHRMLIRYIAEGLPALGMPEGERMKRALELALYQVKPQAVPDTGNTQKLEDTLASSKQLYAGLISLIGSRDSFSLEIAVPQGTEEALLMIAVPKGKGDIVERLINSVFPGARVSEMRGDYNVFNADGAHAGATVGFAAHPVLPLKTYGSFEHDPMNVTLAAFAKLAKFGEGAALQIIVGNEGDRYNEHYGKIARELEKGESIGDALKTPETFFGLLVHDITTSLFSGKKPDAPKTDKVRNDAAHERAMRKVADRIVPVNIRIVASAPTETRARELVENIAAPLAQFDDPGGNRLVCKEVTGRTLKNLMHSFTFRLFEPRSALPMNTAELVSLVHFTADRVTTSRELSKARGKEAAAPVSMPHEGIVMGLNEYGGTTSEIRFGDSDRLRHCYVIGQTGTGKTAMLKNMIIQDIERGAGVGFIDPHGNDIEDILAAIPPEREKDVIYFDPASGTRAMGLNLLEYDATRPEMKTLLVDELYGIFRKLFPDVPEAFGPMFEQYYRNATMLVLEDPASGSTMMEIPRVFASSEFRRLKLSRCKNPVVVQFWRDIAEKTGGEHSLENMVPWITSKFDPFLANDIIRPIVAQQHSSIDFRSVLDGKKIFLANLSKGRLGERNMALLGLVLVSKFAQAAFSRADTRGETEPFYLYIDEFQNFTTPSIASILSEARKYKLSLTLAHQFLAQLTDDIRDAVIGNVGTKCVFRVGATDAEFLEKQLQPVFSAHDLENLENFHASVSLLVDGTPAAPFSMKTVKPNIVDYDRVDALKKVSSERFGRDRAEVEAEIRTRFTGERRPESGL